MSWAIDWLLLAVEVLDRYYRRRVLQVTTGAWLALGVQVNRLQRQRDNLQRFGLQRGLGISPDSRDRSIELDLRGDLFHSV